MAFMPLTTDSTRKNYQILCDFLKNISYKPGWSIRITEEQNEYAFTVTVVYDDYESQNAVFTPLAKLNEQATRVAARLTGKTYRHPEKRYFNKRFDMLSLDRMAPEDVIRHVIADTIKQAEMYEFERWFKIYGDRVFGDVSG